MVMAWLLAAMADVVARAVTFEDDGRFESSGVSSSVRRRSSSLLLPLMAGCNGALQTRGEEVGAKSSTRPWRNGN